MELFLFSHKTKQKVGEFVHCLCIEKAVVLVLLEHY